MLPHIKAAYHHCNTHLLRFITLNRRELGVTHATRVVQCERGPDLRDAPGFAVRGNGRLEFLVAVYAPVALTRTLPQNGLELVGALR